MARDIIEKCPHCGTKLRGELEQTFSRKVTRGAVKKGSVTAASTVAGAAIGSVVPIAGTAVGAAIGFATGVVAGAVMDDKVNKVSDDFEDILFDNATFNFVCPNCGNSWKSEYSNNNKDCEYRPVNQDDEDKENTPAFNIATIGHVDHGKTTLTAAISSVLSKRSQAKMYSYGYIDNAEEIDINGAKCYCSQIEYDSDIRRYFHCDMPNHADYVKALVTGAIRLDGAIVVVSATDGPMPQTREHVLIARQLNVRRLVVFLNKCDMVEDDEMLDLVELEVKEILAQYDFEDETPIIRGSSLGALKGDKKWEDAIDELIYVCDDWFEEPERDIDKAFLMPIEDVFSIYDRGTVVTGRIETGIIHVDDDVQILGFGSRLMSTVTGVEMFNKILAQGEAGDNVGLLLKGIDKDKITRGMIVTQSGVVKLHKKFKAAVYIFKKEEGGRSTPFGNKYRPQFYIRTMDLTGEITLPKGVEMVMPGDNVEIDVTLICEVALNPGLQIAIREGGCLVGLGVVTQLR